MAKINYKLIAHELWDLLDDIDTYGDMFKPEQGAYFRAVNRKVLKRFKYMTSDGYTIKPIDEME